MDIKDIEEYWPEATEIQQKVIEIYHGSGWNIESGGEYGPINMCRPDTFETVEHCVILEDGKVVKG